MVLKKYCISKIDITMCIVLLPNLINKILKSYYINIVLLFWSRKIEVIQRNKKLHDIFLKIFI